MISETAEDDEPSRWELVEMNKIHEQQSNIRALKCIVLSNRLISHVNSVPSDISFKYCSELDLSNALIGRWSKLIEILSLFPVLQTLHLNRNRLEPLEKVDLSTLVVSSPIIQLSLSNCFLSEQTVCKLVTKVFTNLEEIYIAFNQLTSYSPLGDCFKLQKVDLQGNKICEFAQISKLSTLPRLEFLNLSNCGLKKIEFSSDDTKIGYSKLNTLFIQHNPALDKWSFIHELARLNALKKLVIRGVLLPGSRGMDSREMIVAKMAHLVDLDRCDILLWQDALLNCSSKLFDFDPTDISMVELRRKNYPAEQLKRTRDNRLGQFNLENGDGIAFVTD
uniref:Uncharacterized protein n=1 Tax=Ditylenchus dipsaci TaxID=166011 RepID=A0A915E9D3_9BILA